MNGTYNISRDLFSDTNDDSLRGHDTKNSKEGLDFRLQIRKFVARASNIVINNRNSLSAKCANYNTVHMVMGHFRPKTRLFLSVNISYHNTLKPSTHH